MLIIPMTSHIDSIDAFYGLSSYQLYKNTPINTTVSPSYILIVYYQGICYILLHRR